MQFDARNFLVGLIVILLSITLHEFGHAFSADRLGDPTPRSQGRVTLWPDKHLDPLGTIMIIFTLLSGFGIGWGKPVMYNPRYFKSYRWGTFITKICGPLMNLLIALVVGLFLRISLATGHVNWMYERTGDGFSLYGLFAIEFLVTNLALMFFNLIPIHPLDGQKILSSLMPMEMGQRFDIFMEQYGMIFLIIVAVSGGRIIGPLLTPAISHAVQLIVGSPLFG